MPIQWLTDAGGLAEPVEMHGTAKESWSNDKISCSVQLRCPWANRYPVLSNILTYAPAWPYHTDQVCYAVSGGISAAPGVNTADGSGLNYDEALIDVQFETVTKKEDAEPGEISVYDESIEPTAEFLTVSHEKFHWGSIGGDALVAAEAPGRLELGLDYVVTLYNLTSIPPSVLTLGGKSNSAAVTSASLGLTFGIETLLFNPPKITRKIAVGGDNFYTLQLRYTFKQAGWNWFWRAKTQGYAQIYHEDDGSVYKNFPPASFAGLIP